MSSYDKLGDMLNNVLNSGKIPEYEKKSEKAGRKPEENENKSKDNNKKNTKINNNVYNFIHLYKIFNLDPETCTQEDLKTAYHKLLKRYHPDNYTKLPELKKAAEKKTREVIEAYKKLTDLIG